jgi:NADH-quinone oxidoreductase subunit J
MSVQYLLFFVLSLAAITGAVFMINFTRVVHMVLALGITFISIAGLFVLLQAEFVAFVQILIYGGAISILMLFGIMLTKHDAQEEGKKRPSHTFWSFLGVAVFLVVLLWHISNAPWPGAGGDFAEKNTMAIGQLLFSKFVIPFEIVSVLLTVAFIGAVLIARKGADES